MNNKNPSYYYIYEMESTNEDLDLYIRGEGSI